MEVGANIGDKWLTARRIYTFPLTNGYSKQSLQALTELLQYPGKIKLNERISSAEKRKVADEAASLKTRTKKNDREH